jgi:hypothetical protein
MKISLKLEELAQLGLAIYLFSLLDIAWWWYLVLFLVPDLGMLGYLINSRIGAWSYNLFHHKAIAICIYLLGVFLSNEQCLLAGCILFGHAAFDRILGYGLKYSDSFNHTHLGNVGNSAKTH